jgi:hypothetical protein
MTNIWTYTNPLPTANLLRKTTGSCATVQATGIVVSWSSSNQAVLDHLSREKFFLPTLGQLPVSTRPACTSSYKSGISGGSSGSWGSGGSSGVSMWSWLGVVIALAVLVKLGLIYCWARSRAKLMAALVTAQ